MATAAPRDRMPMGRQERDLRKRFAHLTMWAGQNGERRLARLVARVLQGEDPRQWSLVDGAVVCACAAYPVPHVGHE